jgi:hypothetical protein
VEVTRDELDGWSLQKSVLPDGAIIVIVDTVVIVLLELKDEMDVSLIKIQT